nr:reverse transcriptase domain-containing protein [Tanacetum cinerariifolium]
DGDMPCLIRFKSKHKSHALINLEKLSFPELTPTRMTLELADRSITRPKRVAKDVFVKLGKFHFPTDFVVVDFEADPRYNPKSSNPTLVSDDSISENDSCKVPIVKSSSLTLTQFGESDFILEEIEDFLNDDSTPDEIDDYVFDPERDIRLIKKLINADPCSLPPMDLKLAEESKEKSSVEEPPELELKDLPSHLEYAFLEDSNKLPVIIAKNLKVDEREALLKMFLSLTNGLLLGKSLTLRVLTRGYIQIPIDPQDQEKTTFTCPYGTFAYRRMPFCLCDAPARISGITIASPYPSKGAWRSSSMVRSVIVT